MKILENFTIDRKNVVFIGPSVLFWDQIIRTYQEFCLMEGYITLSNHLQLWRHINPINTHPDKTSNQGQAGNLRGKDKRQSQVYWHTNGNSWVQTPCHCIRQYHDSWHHLPPVESQAHKNSSNSLSRWCISLGKAHVHCGTSTRSYLVKVIISASV